MSQPVTQHYFRHTGPNELAQYATPRGHTACWFVRLIDVRDPTDVVGRAALLRDLVALLIRPALFITSTPLPLYQDLLQRFGFTRSDAPAHYDFAEDTHQAILDRPRRPPALGPHFSSPRR